MQDQATSTSGSPPPPAVVLEDAPETESSIPDFKEQLSDIDTSSLEDLLAMDTRPNSSNRKSVSFSDFIDVEIVSPEPQKKSPSPEFRNFTVKPILKKDLKQTESMRRLLDYAAERLYKDLLMLVEERDRSIHALELTPEEDDHALSTQTCIFQKRYRDRLLENKLTLDKRIDQVWQKLKDMAVDGQIGQFVYGVRHSSELTLNVKRRVNLRRESLPLPRKTRSDIEMVCDLSRRLSLVREQLKHKDPLEESSLSMENMLSAVSRIINGSNGKATC
nr:Protein DEL-2, isoform a [Haemonchus contortus]CDJ95409.1 Protein DEL-2, isoform b [Haemonchus contortus]